MAESFRIITESEMKKGIFTSKDFPIVLGIGAKLLAYTKDIFYKKNAEKTHRFNGGKKGENFSTTDIERGIKKWN